MTMIETMARAGDEPGVDPDFHSYCPLPDEGALGPALFQDMLAKQREAGATFNRLTIVSPEYPNLPYPHGLYVEGWLMQPREQAPFAFPIDAAMAEERGE